MLSAPPNPSAAAAPGERERAVLGLRLLAAYAVLNGCLCVRWPAPTPLSAWLLPGLDVAILLAGMALFAPAPGWSAPWFSRIVAAVLVVLRLGRIADGVCLRYLDRRFHVVADMALVPEFARLVRSNLGWSGLALALGALCVASFVLFHCLTLSVRVFARVLGPPRAGDAFLMCVGAYAVLVALTSPHAQLVSKSVAPRVLRELELWLEARGQFDDPEHAARRRAFTARFDTRQSLLRSTPAALARTGKPDVHVLLVEAYGHTAQSTPAYRKQLAPAYAAFADAVNGAGFVVCSSYVRATVFGGNSWMTHASLQTAVPIYDQFEYSLLLEHSQHASLARAFGAAGYRTVSVKPGTTRPAPMTRIYGFEREYIARDFGYRGRSYAWSPMPDQFVLQQIAQRELAQPTRPLFLEYALVTSHFPWTPQPQYVPSSQSLGDGSLFVQQPPLEFREPRAGLNAQTYAYLNSLGYDLRVISDYLVQHVRGDSLVVILGDHQPIAPVAGEDRSRATPLHVLSRRGSLLAPLLARGCTPGMFGARDEPSMGMEDLGITILRLLSGELHDAGGS